MTSEARRAASKRDYAKNRAIRVKAVRDRYWRKKFQQLLQELRRNPLYIWKTYEQVERSTESPRR